MESKRMMNYSSKVEDGRTCCQLTNQAEREEEGREEERKVERKKEGIKILQLIYKKQNELHCVFTVTNRAEDILLTTVESIASQV